MHADMDPTDPGRVRHLGQGVLQRDGLALAGVAVQTHHRPHRGRVRDRPQHRPNGRCVHHLGIRDQGRDLRQMLLLPQKHLPTDAFSATTFRQPSSLRGSGRRCPATSGSRPVQQTTHHQRPRQHRPTASPYPLSHPTITPAQPTPRHQNSRT
ncbi:hypothetical protein QFZ43_008781 [Streptomyces afghaniensis]|nr:hypothetical protein [Streptomyces afghaniensis]